MNQPITPTPFGKLDTTIRYSGKIKCRKCRKFYRGKRSEGNLCPECR